MYMAPQPVRNVRMPMPPAGMLVDTKRIPLATSYTPVQEFRKVMTEGVGLRKGTIFEELYLPLEEGGLPRGR